MSTLVIKNLPEHLHAALKSQAQRNHRSLNKEAVALIEQAIAPPSPAHGLPPPIKLKGGPITIEEIEAAIAEGRFAHYRSLDEVNAYVDELRQDREMAP